MAVATVRSAVHRVQGLVWTHRGAPRCPLRERVDLVWRLEYDNQVTRWPRYP